MAPFDPLQLLKLLSPLLSLEGGIKSADEVPRLSSLMKKFSKKLVSRCVYCNVLKATKPEVLNAFLDLEGWMTINTWLVDARDNDNDAFLEELLLLCKMLPMTVVRLKQNNTAKLVKTLTKSENTNIRKVSYKLVETWMKLIKGATPLPSTEKSGPDKTKKKKVKKEAGEEGFKLQTKDEKSSDGQSPPRTSSLSKISSYDDQEDVEYEPEPPIEKVKHKEPRPKTVKTLQTRFRSTGLIEELMLPKTVAKKPTPQVDREIIAAATKKRLSTATMPAYPEKKVKPINLITPASETIGPGIKLIAPKPRPVHIIQESAGFMAALDAAPTPMVRKKKTRKTPSSPTTPPPTASTAPPKLQFYKDTLELGEGKTKTEEAEEAEPAAASGKESPEPSKSEPASTAVEEESSPTGPILRRSMRGKKKLEDEQKRLEEEEEAKRKKLQEEEDDEATEEEDYTDQMEADGDDSEATQEGDEVPADSEDKTSATTDSQEVEEIESENGSKKVKSILMLTRRKDKKKSVRWVQDDHLKQFFYFEMDENERVNVNNMRNFGDLKSLEMKRERMNFETARRRISDNMSEGMPWRPLRLIDLPPALVEPGSTSKERDIQLLRQKTTLEEIYFSREMLPETPHEPDPELAGPAPQEPILIPGEDMTNPGVLMDYSTMDLPPPKAALPPVLTNLMMSIGAPYGNNEEDIVQMGGGMNDVGGPPGQHGFMGDMGPMHQEQFSPTHLQPQMQGPMQPQQQQQQPPPHMQGMGGGPQMWGNPGGEPQQGPNWMTGPPMDPMGMYNDGPPPDDMMGPPNNMNFGGGLPPQQMFQGGGGPPHRHMRGGYGGARNQGPRRGGPNRGGGGGGNMWRPPRVVCKHFMSGTCRFGKNCNFLHPGINGPAL